MRTIYHRDHTVTIWNVLAQSWYVRVSYLSHAVLATLSERERARVVRHLAGARRADDETAHFRGEA